MKENEILATQKPNRNSQTLRGIIKNDVFGEIVKAAKQSTKLPSKHSENSILLLRKISAMSGTNK